MKDKAMAMEALDQVSGGKYSDYVKVTDAIHKRMKELGGGKNCMRLPEDGAAAWLSENLNVTAEFNTDWGFDFLNSAAVYKDARADKAGIRYTQDEVLKMIANWNPKK